MKKPKLFPKSVLKKISEFNRDITSLSSPPVLGFICVLVFGFKSAFLILLPLFVFNEIFCSAIKFFFFKNRPKKESFQNWYEKIEASSFPSIHASRFGVFLSSFFLLKVQNPDFFLVFPLVFLFFLLVLNSRILLKKHFFIDIFWGGIIGILIGFCSRFFF